jgi:hypothetical protein
VRDGGGHPALATDPYRPLEAAPSAPLVGLDDPASQHSTVGFEALAGDDKAELVEPAERGQVRASEGSVSMSRSSRWAV